MACGLRREPEGIYGNEEDANVATQGTDTRPATTSDWHYSPYDPPCTSDDNDNSLSQRLQSVDLNEPEQMAPPLDWSSTHDVPVCLHQGSPGISPVLITLPFQDSDHLQNFVPCTVCHLPNVAMPGPGASDAVAFCVSEVNIRTSQLILVPCYLCWRSRPMTGMPEQIKVPLFHSTLNGSVSTNQSENSLRFVPCSVCLIPEHALSIVDTPPPNVESRSQQTSSHSINTQITDEPPHIDNHMMNEDMLQNAPVSWFIPFSRRTEYRSLQLAFLLHCKQVVNQVRQRQRELPQKATLRLESTRNLQVFSHRTQHKPISIPDFTNYQPFSHTQMRNHTERIYKNLPEVREQKTQQVLQQARKTHRIMAYIFQKKLQQATLRGKVSWLITESCM